MNMKNIVLLALIAAAILIIPQKAYAQEKPQRPQQPSNSQVYKQRE